METTMMATSQGYLVEESIKAIAEPHSVRHQEETVRSS